MALCGTDALGSVAPDAIVVMSRAFAEEIARIAKSQAPKAEIILYSDLIERARLKPAA